MNKACTYPFFGLLTAVVAVAQPAPKPTLTVEKIMQDPKAWVGTSPSNPFWADDSKTVYFSWNPAAAKGDSLYKITLAGDRKPLKVSPAERRILLVQAGTSTYNRTRTQRLFERDGDLFWIEIGTGKSHQFTNTTEPETDPVFLADENTVAFRRGQNLFSANLITGEITQRTDFKTGSKKPEPKLTDEEKFLKADQLRLSTVLTDRKAKRDEAERIAKADKPRRAKEIFLEDKALASPQLSPDGRFVTYRLTKAAVGAKTAQVPNYVTESGYTEEIQARTKVGAPLPTSEFFVYNVAQDTTFAVSSKQLSMTNNQVSANGKTALADTVKPRTTNRELPKPTTIFGPVWSEDSKLAVVVVRSQDNRNRWICRLDLPGSTTALVPTLTILDHQHDDAWIGGPGVGSSGTGNMGFLPDNQTIWFQSEADGYSHLYTVNVTTGKKKQLTSGKFEVQQAFLSKDKQHFFLTTNEVHPGETHFYRMSIAVGERVKLTTMTGANDVTLSPDETTLLIRHSAMNKPWELYSYQLTANSKQLARATPRSVSLQTGATLSQAGTATRLTESRTDAFRQYPWREPELVQILARDGAQVWARLYKPQTANGKAVVFVHGAGYLQNAHKWWSQYFREYMFHNLLTDKGYTVLDIDYRGSAGYGRDWRTGIYRFMGGKDLTDHVDAADWLVKNHGVSANRIGMYGGSYGGFITLMAMFTTPGKFAAGAALRPVTDWAAYNHGYTANILNEPQTDSLAYKRSSPIYHAEGLTGHLLICHGMVDVNVHFQDAVRLAQRLIELKKENWELAVYPVEDHGFVEPSSWTDEYRRILKLFDERL